MPGRTACAHIMAAANGFRLMIHSWLDSQRRYLNMAANMAWGMPFMWKCPYMCTLPSLPVEACDAKFVALQGLEPWTECQRPSTVFAAVHPALMYACMWSYRRAYACCHAAVRACAFIKVSQTLQTPLCRDLPKSYSLWYHWPSADCQHHNWEGCLVLSLTWEQW